MGCSDRSLTVANSTRIVVRRTSNEAWAQNFEQLTQPTGTVHFAALPSRRSIQGKTYQRAKNRHSAILAIPILILKLLRISRETTNRSMDSPNISGSIAKASKREPSSTNLRETIPFSAIRWYDAGAIIKAMAIATRSNAARCKSCSTGFRS